MPWHREAIILVVLLSIAASNAPSQEPEVIEVVVQGFVKDRGISVGLLNLTPLDLAIVDPRLSEDGHWDLNFATWVDFREVFLVGVWKGNTPFLQITDRIRAAGTRLSAADLRVGHHLRISYRPGAHEADVEVVGYQPPTKALCLNLTVDLPDGYGLQPAVAETVVRTRLSWLLPPDVTFRCDTESGRLQEYGKVSAQYRLHSSQTQWLVRSTAISEELQISTRLQDPTLTSSWADIQVRGGRSPGASDHPMDERVEDALIKLPPFSVTRAKQ